MEFIIGTIISIVAIISGILIAIWQQHQSRNHPYLTPIADLPFNMGTFDSLNSFDIQVQNSGAASATNICGVIIKLNPNLPPESIDKIFVLKGKASLQEKEVASIHVDLKERAGSVRGKLRIGKYSFYPLQEPSFVARLTLIYEDSSGRKYIGIFDYTSQHQWQQVKFLRGIRRNLRPLNDLIHSASTPELVHDNIYRIDWGEAPNIEKFHGREQEYADLKQWILKDNCRLVALLGIGGIGKTALSAKLADDMKNEFTYVFWRSLQNAPPLQNVLEKCILFLSNQQRFDMPQDIEEQISLLIKYLKEKHCLLVLDNIETVLQGGNRTGQYLAGYEGYGRLIQRIGETRHQSCLLLTSREKPKEVALLEGKSSPVRSLELLGVGEKEGKEILNDKDLHGSDEVIADLVRLYSGNPLALRLVSEPIQRLFRGNIAEFLKVKAAVFGDVYKLLDQQFQRLSELERSVIYWLSIEREPTSLENLNDTMVDSVQARVLLEALDSLHGRSMIETSSIVYFTLQPVIMEYVTDKFSEQMHEEISTETIGVIRSHALVKALSKDYVRDSQVRLILTPVAQRLYTNLGKESVEGKLKKILSTQRELQPHILSYVAGNVLSLLINLNYDLRGYDFSHLMILQAYLRGVALPDVNFTWANFAKSVFTDTFGSIFSVILSFNEEVLVAGTDAGDIQLWQTASGIPLFTCHGHSDWVRSVAFSPDNRTLVSGSDDQTIRFWDANTGQCLKTLLGHSDWIRTVAFSPDGRILASGSDDQAAKIWEVSSGQCLQTLQGHTNGVMSVAFSPDGQILATGSEDQTVRFWDVSSWQCLRTLQGHTNEVMSVAFSPDGRSLVTGSQDQTIKIWEVSTGQCLKTLFGHTNGVMSVAFSPDGQMLASGSEDRTVKVWNSSTGECFKTFQGHTTGVRSIVFSRNGDILISGADDRTVKFWDIGTGQCNKTLQGYTNGLRSVAFRPPDGAALASGGTDLTTKIWDVSTGRCLEDFRGHTSGVRSVAFSPDGEFLATGSHDWTVKIWKVSTGRCQRTLEEHLNWVWSVAFSPDGQLLATGSHDQTIKIWDVGTGQCLKTLSGHTSGVRSLAFHPNGLILVSGSEDRAVKVWEVSTGQCLETLQGHTRWVKSVAFGPDGQIFASGSEDQTVKIWDVKTMQCLKTLHGHTGWVYCVAFSPDGQLLASGGAEGTIKVWDVKTWQCLKTLHEHTGWVMTVAFSPNSQMLVSGGNEGTMKFWEVQTGECLKVLKSGPYDRMNITEAMGLTVAQKTMLKTLGAVED